MLTHLGGLPAPFRQSKKKARSSSFGPFPSLPQIPALPSRVIPLQEEKPDPKKKDSIQNAGKVNLHKGSPHIAIPGFTPNPHTRLSILLAVTLSVDNCPYIVPLSFGFEGNCLYFHTAREGKKIDMIRQNNTVCFELEADCEVVRAESPCD